MSSFLEKYQKVPVEIYPSKVVSQPLVSVCIQTYQHANYIKQCLEGILMQKTTFPFEILLGEDNSTDGTREICLEYAKKYPKKIRLFLHARENNIKINGQPTGRFNFVYNLFIAKGKYIALCEGDDYWTDPLKLQKQVDFLEANPEFSICYHNVDILNDNNLRPSFLNRSKNTVFSINDLANSNLIHTPSVVYRNLLIDLPNWLNKSPVGDYPLHMLHAEKGKIFCIAETMGVYRENVGIWSTNKKNNNKYSWLIVLRYLLENIENKDARINLFIQLNRTFENIKRIDFPELQSIIVKKNLKKAYSFQNEKIRNTPLFSLLKALVKKIIRYK